MYSCLADIPKMSIEEAQHFEMDEVKCKCGKCNVAIVVPELVYLLEMTRELYGKPMIVNSWNRCKHHNKAVGGVENSSHCKGYAVDIDCPSSSQRYDLVSAALLAGFPIIKIYYDFIHLDVNPYKHWGMIYL